MIGDPLKKVTTGQPFVPNAASWNAFAEAARAHLQKQSNTGKPYRPAGGDRATMALVQNTGSGVDRFGILSITGSIVDPASKIDEFSNYLAFRCGDAQPNTPFVITLDPIANNAVGMAVVAGVVPCQVLMQHATDVLADVNSSGVLASGPSGTMEILWAASGTYPATCWALVRFGNAPPAPHCAQVVSLIPGGVTANPWDALKGQVITNPTTGVPDVLTLKGSYTATILPNLQVGALVEYTPQPSQGGVTACHGWLKADVFLPSWDTLPGSGMADYMVLQLKNNPIAGGYQMVWDDTKLPGDITS
jgi:hypothetical protein